MSVGKQPRKSVSQGASNVQLASFTTRHRGSAAHADSPSGSHEWKHVFHVGIGGIGATAATAAHGPHSELQPPPNESHVRSPGSRSGKGAAAGSALSFSAS